MAGHWQNIDNSGETLRIYLAQPVHGSSPGIILLHDASGMTEDICHIADRLAEEGYVVLAPRWNGHADPHIVRAQFAVWDGALKAHPLFRGQTGAVGFGSGAALALHAAAQGLVACAAAYTATDVRPVRPASPAVLHLVGSQGQHAWDDPNVRIYRYPDSSAGFWSPGHAAYDKASADVALSRTLTLLRRTIGPDFDLDALWEAHRACEFVTRDAKATMETMVPQPYVNHVPTMTGGYGHADLYRFYRDHFIPKNPKDMRNIPISRTVGTNRVVNEGILCFTHDIEIDWLLPGVPPTGRYVEIPLVGIITFHGNKLAHEHIYWDHASLLVQVGLLDPAGLPVGGADVARKVADPSRPANHLLPSWRNATDTASKPASTTETQP